MEHNRGGARQGAGRPKGQGVAKNITFDQDVWEAVEKLALELDEKPAELIRQVVAEYVKNAR